MRRVIEPAASEAAACGAAKTTHRPGGERSPNGPSVLVETSGPAQRVEALRTLASGSPTSLMVGDLQRQATPRSLPPSLRQGVEAMSGMSMADVRVFHGSEQPARLQALAFARGRDIHLAPGEERQLPHEAWHIVQQAQGRVPATTRIGSVSVNDDPHLEREADVMGSRALARPPAMARTAPVAVIEDDDLMVLQGRFGVQIDLNTFDIEDPVSGKKSKKKGPPPTHKETLIDRVYIAGRPAGLFSGGEKSHTTSWALYTDQIRNAMLGRSPEDARDAIVELYEDAKRLPGVDRVDALGALAKTRYDDAKQAIDGLIATDVDPATGAPFIIHVQDLARAYLAYRNVVPLSQANIGAATGHGESKDLLYLRSVNDQQEGWAEVSTGGGNMELEPDAQREVKISIWRLLDAGTLRHLLSDEAGEDTAPGARAGEKGSVRVVDAIAQHIHSVQVAYPDLVDESFVKEEDSIKAYLVDIGLGNQKTRKDVAQGVVAKLAHNEPTTKDNPSRSMTEGFGDQGAFAVQVRLDNQSRVDDLLIGGRPVTVLGSAQGSHTTAWLVYIDVVRNAILRKSPSAAIAAMDQLSAALDTLPGAHRVEGLTDVHRETFDPTLAYLKGVRGEAKAASTDFERVVTLQRLIKAYMEMRNAMPLSQIKGGLASGKAEARNRAVLRWREGGFASWTGKGDPPTKTTKTYSEAFWALLDHEALSSIGDGGVSKHDAPGLRQTAEEKKLKGTDKAVPKGLMYVASTVRQHLMTMKAAYPGVYGVLKPDGEAELRKVFASIELASSSWDFFYANAKPS